MSLNLRSFHQTRRHFLTNSAALAGAVSLSPFNFGPSAAQSADSMLWFCSTAVEALELWKQGFAATNGGNVEYYRQGGVRLSQRFEQEVRANQVSCSAISLSFVSLMKKWAERGLLMPYKSPELAAVPKKFVFDDHLSPTISFIASMAFNADFVKPEEAPKKWEDLLDPKWKGKLVMGDAIASASSLSWFNALRKTFGQEFMQELAKQDILVRSGGGEIVDSMTTGERPVAAMVLQYHVERAIKAGANLYVVCPEEGVPATYTYTVIPAAAPQPELAKKFLDYILSRDAQTMWEQEFGLFSLRNDMPAYPRTDRGVRVLRDLKTIGSDIEDLLELEDKQIELSDEFSELFKV